jgi:hypothetical protein
MDTDNGLSSEVTDMLRDSFEKWISEPPFEKDISRYPADEEAFSWPAQYQDYTVECAWCAWQESFTQTLLQVMEDLRDDEEETQDEDPIRSFMRMDLL